MAAPPDLSKLGPLPADVARLLREAETAPQPDSLPIVQETRHNMANYGLALADDGNPAITFDIPHSPGVERKMFPFSWDAFDRYLTSLQNFREEQGPKAE